MTINKDIARHLPIIQRELRSMGFRRTENMRSKIEHDVQIYEKEEPLWGVKLVIQLWGDGKHRATYWHPNLFVPADERGPYGHQTTEPIYFTGVVDMRHAIAKSQADWQHGESAIEERVLEVFRRTGQMPDRRRLREQAVIGAAENATKRAAYVKHAIVTQLSSVGDELKAMADAYAETGDVTSCEPSSYAIEAQAAIYDLMVSDRIIEPGEGR